MAQQVKNQTNIREDAVRSLVSTQWVENPAFPCSCHGSAETNLTSIHEDAGSIPGLAQRVMSCGVGRRCSSDPMLLWLWRRPVATSPIGPLAWEPPYASGSGPRKA